MKKLTKNHIISTLPLLVSFFIVSLYSYFFSTVSEIWFDIKIEADAKTTTQFFFDTGAGFSPDKSYSRIVWANTPTTLNLQLPSEKTRRIRIDFDYPATKILIHKCALFDLSGGGRKKIFDLNNLSSTHNTGRIVLNKGRMTAEATGDDPQLIFTLPPTSFSPKINYPSILLHVFILFPFVLAAQKLFLFLWQKKEPPHTRSFNTLYTLLIVFSLVLWGGKIFCLFYEKTHEKVIAVQQNRSYKSPYNKPFIRTPLSFLRPDGIKIAGYIYTSKKTRKDYPAIILLHGNYPQGQQFPLYPVLATELATKGFIVMSIDIAGFGVSEDPFARDNAVDLSMQLETTGAIDYLYDHKNVKEGVLLLGHSMGAVPALRVGLDDPRAKGIILIGPPRRVRERFNFLPDINLFWWWAGKVRKEQYGISTFPSWYNKERMTQNYLKQDIIYLLPRLKKGGHKPLLLIDGSNEPKEDKLFLEQYVESCRPPVSLLRLPDAEHNCNVLFNGKSTVYNPNIMKQLTDAIVKWNDEIVITEKEHKMREIYCIFNRIQTPALLWTL